MTWHDFVQQTRDLGIDLTPEQIEQFRLYTQMLMAANRQFNLTALREEEMLLVKYHLDSLSLLPIIARHAGLELAELRNLAWDAVDVGSGGGAPAIPLAIAWPLLRYTLIESIGKKARFLRQAVGALGLNVTVVNDRVEVAAHESQHRQHYHLVTARAVAALPTLVELTLPLARMGGIVVLPKGPRAQAELAQAEAAISLLGGELAGVEEVSVPGEDAARVVIVLRKVAPTPDEYPRRPGLPAKKPLLASPGRNA